MRRNHGRRHADAAPRPAERAAQTIQESLLTPKEAATFMRISKSWLAKARMRGDGPPYAKYGRSVRYQKQHLVDYTRSRLRRSTLKHD
jgi:hypothetical protein